MYKPRQPRRYATISRGYRDAKPDPSRWDGYTIEDPAKIKKIKNSYEMPGELDMTKSYNQPPRGNRYSSEIENFHNNNIHHNGSGIIISLSWKTPRIWTIKVDEDSVELTPKEISEMVKFLKSSETDFKLEPVIHRGRKVFEIHKIKGNRYHFEISKTEKKYDYEYDIATAAEVKDMIDFCLEALEW